MTPPRFKRFGLIGCGLIGGSFALALKRTGLIQHVAGFSRSPASAEQARQLGVIDEVTPCAQSAVTGADLVLLAVPVAATEATLHTIRDALAPDALVMDVGSTKGDVVEAARKGLAHRFGCFVPAHPIAGKEVAGVAHAQASLFDQHHVVLTPAEGSIDAQVQRARALWTAIGAKVITMAPPAHDNAFAAVSHLPHLLAFAYIQGLAGQVQSQQLFDLAGPGFRDFSRIAASDPSIWRDILLSNREQVLSQSRAFRDALDAFEALMRQGDPAMLEQAIAQASRTRAQWHPSSVASDT